MTLPLAEIEEAIAAVGEAAARPRLRRCLDTLHRSLDLWPGPQRCDGSLFVVTATPNSCVALCAPQGWPALDPAAVATIAKAEIAATLVAAIETATPEQHGGILIGVAALLGHDGVAAQIDDAKGIVAAGGSPLTVGAAAW
jgi:hypothetical protein